MPGIKKVSIRETKIMLPDAEAAEGFRNENTWVLDTEGTNLLDVSRCPSHPKHILTGWITCLALQRRSLLVRMHCYGGWHTDMDLSTQVMSHPGVDYTRTVSNHIIDIIDVLGIEAARAALLKVCFPCILTYRLAQLQYWSHRPRHAWATAPCSKWYS